tara:strand:- start:1241 stop:2599 length:1359 start_codon:yes stop_codon:yes gene_type:complete
MKIKLPSIPDDDDAKGIVVRVISYEYYLKKFWLTFINPYIEVEYQIAIRRERLNKLFFISIYNLIFGLHQIMVKLLYNTDNLTQDHLNLYYIFGSIWIFVSCITIGLIFYKNISSLINLPVIIISISLVLCLTFIFLSINTILKIPDDIHNKYSPLTINFYQYHAQIDIGNNNTYTIYLLNILILVLLSSLILDVRNFIIFIGSFSSITTFIYCYLFKNFNHNFEKVYDFIGWKMGILYHPILYQQSITDYNIQKMLNHIYNQNNISIMLEKQIKYIVPYKKSIFDLSHSIHDLTVYYIFIWIMFISTVFFIVYTNEKRLRAYFILRRIRNYNKDNPHDFETGIKIESFINNNEAQEIIKKNLQKFKKDLNILKEVDINEIENNTESDINLNEFENVLDDKTVKSYQSKTSFNTSEIINSVKNILPKSYTKSEVSDDKSVINDIKSESHVQC